MWLSIRDAAGNILCQEDLLHTGWLVEEDGFVNSDIITIVIDRGGEMAYGVISNGNNDKKFARVEIPSGRVERGQEIDFPAGALLIFGQVAG